MAEIALVTPILLLMMLSIVEFGRAMAIHGAVVTASREAARYGTAVGDNGGGTPRYADCVGIRDAARRVTGALVTLPDAAIQIQYVDDLGAQVTNACPSGVGSAPDPSQIDRFDRVSVTVTHTYQLLMPVISELWGPITVVSADRRSILKP